jgi:hypothetical protein
MIYFSPNKKLIRIPYVYGILFFEVENSLHLAPSFDTLANWTHMQYLIALQNNCVCV